MWKSHQQNKYEKSEKRDKQSVEKKIKTSPKHKDEFYLPSFPLPTQSVSLCLVCVCLHQRRCQWSLVVCRTWCLSGGVMLTEEDWLRPKNSKIAKRLLQTHLINISSLSPRVVLPHEHLLWRPRQQERKKMPTESSCLLDSMPEWGCCGLNRIDWGPKTPKAAKIIKNCQKTSPNTSHQHIIYLIIPLPTRRFASWASALTTAPTGAEEDANGVFFSLGLGAWLGTLWTEEDWLRSQSPQSSQKLAKDFSKCISSTYHISHYIWSSLSPGVALPHAHLLSRPRQHQRKMPMESSCSLVFWIRCLIGDVMLAQRGPQSSPKNPKRLTQNMPTIARVSVCIVCAPFLPAPLSANVLTNCLQPLRRTSLAFLRRSPVKHTKKDQKSSKIFKNHWQVEKWKSTVFMFKAVNRPPSLWLCPTGKRSVQSPALDDSVRALRNHVRSKTPGNLGSTSMVLCSTE